ncbi:hypothetical protein SDC9_38040 [bioreactor metagenome]|uniref:Type I restriction modification DNA specificity domain-containing protein n=1 Tax=bioreactor metagenome TaxID=1076179 RepID=A0A644VN96_9ZZZZ|nr:restriction endonuclease subunit S [Paludibacter sp.]
MNKIEELIEQLCPNGVVFKDIETLINNKSVSTITPPRKLTKNFYQTIGAIPIIDQGQDFIIGYTDNEEVIIDKGLYVIFGDHTEVFKYVDFPFAQGADGIKIIKTNPSVIVSKFLYYALNSYYIKTGKYTRHFSFLKKTFIPIPPLAIQQEIVSILDKFTTLAVNLKDELQARTRQYEYYRNELFNFEGKEAQWETMGEIGTFIRGRRFVKDDITTEGVPCIHYGEMYTHYKIWAKKAKSFLEPTLAAKLRVAHPGDVVIVAAGETIEDIGNGVAWLGESDIVIHDACFTYSHSLNPKYVSYYLQTNLFRSQIKKYISSGKISSINAPGLSKARIPIPPMEEQERIVGILDKFNTLVNDISVGLPAEIQARRNQYEYYRGKLLDFKSISNG